ATLMVANDADGSINAQQRSLPLPKDAEARARAILSRLLELYSAPGATHALPASPRPIAQVFLFHPAVSKKAKPAGTEDGVTAVVNLARSFADSHPSGIATESLTVDSICATLSANFPQITKVRFLVDGEPRSTLAGHADLTRTYLIGDAAQASQNQ
ncbi:MAG TPA: GerMN domain-containing protein, partial [Acidobacteriaceae bacterium]